MKMCWAEGTAKKLYWHNYEINKKKNWFRAFPDVVDGRRTKRIGKKKNADDWWGGNIQGTESLSIGQGSMEAIVLNEKCIKVYKSIDNGNDIVMIIINKG